MKKFNLFLLITIILFILSGCLFFEGNKSPEFLEIPKLNNIPERAGSDFSVKLNVKSFSDIDRIEFYSSFSSIPFYTDTYYNGKKSVNADIPVKAPANDNFYDVFVRIIDKKGNVVESKVKPLFGTSRLITPDRSKPEISMFFEPQKEISRGDNVYRISFLAEDIGTGFSEIKVSINNDNAIYLKILEEFSAIEKNQFFITNETGWSVNGQAVMYVPLNPGENRIKIEMKDKRNNTNTTVISRNIIPEIVEDDLIAEYFAPPFIELKSTYRITLQAETLNYVKEIILDGDKVYPLANEKSDTKALVTIAKNAGDTERIIQHKAVFFSFDESESPVEIDFSVRVRKNQHPTINIEVENLTPDYGTNVPIRVIATDDIGLSIVEVYMNGSKIKEFGSNSFEYDREIGQVMDEIFYWNATRGQHTITAVARDIRNLRTDYRFPEQIQTQYDGKPTLDKMLLESYVGNDSSRKRDIDTHPTFSVAKGDRVFFIAQAWDFDSSITKVEFRLSTGQVFEGFRDVNRPKMYKSAVGFIIPNTLGEIDVDIYLENSMGGNELYKGQKLLIEDNIVDVYKPRIQGNISQTKIQIYEDFYANGIYEDDGRLRYISIEILKVLEDGTKVSINDGQITKVRDPGNIGDSLNLRRASLEMGPWTASDSGNFVAVFEAENNLSIKEKLELYFEVQGLAIEIENPTDGRSFDIGRNDIFFSFYTTEGADAEIIIMFDENNDGIYTLETFRKALEEKDRILTPSPYPGGGYAYKFSGIIPTTNPEHFPETGKYRFIVRTKYGAFEEEEYVDINVHDFTRPSLSISDGIILESLDIKSAYPDLKIGGEKGIIVDNNYFIPLNYKTGINTTNLKLTLNIEDYGNIKGVEIIYRDTINYVNQEINMTLTDFQMIDGPQNSKKRKFTYEGEFPSNLIRVDGNQLLEIKVIDSVPNNELNTNYNLFGLEIEKPQISKYTLNVSQGLESYNITKEIKPEISLNVGTNYNVFFSDIIFEDNHFLDRFIFYLRDSETDEIIEISNSVLAIPRKRVTNPTDFNIANLSFETPKKSGVYELVMELRDKTYSRVENTHYESEARKYNRVLEEIPIRIMNKLPPAITITFDDTNDEGIGLINSFTPNIYINAQDPLDSVLLPSIKVFFEMPDGRTNQLTVSNILKSEDDQIRVNVTGIPADVYDGKGKLYIKFRTNDNPVEEHISSKFNMVIDILSEYNIPRLSREGNKLFSKVNGRLVEDFREAVIYYKKISDEHFIPVEAIRNNLNNELYLDIGNLSSGTYTAYVYVVDKAGNVFESTPIPSFIVEANNTKIRENTVYGRNKNVIVLPIGKNTITLENRHGLITVDAEMEGVVKSYTVNGESVLEINIINDFGNLSESFKTLYLTTYDASGKAEFFEIELYRYSTPLNISDISFYNESYFTNVVISNENKGYNPMKIDVNTNLFIKSIFLEELKVGTTTIFENRYMRESNSLKGRNDFEYIIPKIPNNIEGDAQLKVKMFDLAGRESIVKNMQFKIDTKNPEIDDFKLNNVILIDGKYFSDDLNIEIQWKISDYTVNEKYGNVYLIVDSTEYNLRNKISGDISEGNINLNDILTLRNNREYLIWLKVVDGAGNTTYNDDEPLTLKIEIDN